MSRAALLAALVAAVAPAGPVRAELPAIGGEVSLRAVGYRPAIDAELQGGAGPYALVFGHRRMWGGRLDHAWTFATPLGTGGLGLGTGYLTVSGYGRYRDADGVTLLESGDRTALHLVPATLFATWRLDAVGGWRLPIAPYVRAALERYHWIVTGTSHASTTGATNGWSVTAGLALSLDGLDPDGVLSTGRTSPIRHTALTLDLTRARVDDFGSARSWDLSTDGLAVGIGLMFAY